MKDFTPTKETISLHGLGFIQLVLGGNQRMHVWHPDLPRRKCYEHSGVHNHRFAFTSRVLKGTQINQRADIEIVRPDASEYFLISHNGPRGPNGGRESYPVANVNIHFRDIEMYEPGMEYFMPHTEYHHTPNDGIVITVLKKHEEVSIHANSTCRVGVEFDYGFDRFQLTPDVLYDFVNDAFRA